MKNKEFSVLMSVYYRDNAGFLKDASDSIINQSLMPSEIVLVQDGRITSELQEVIFNYQSYYPDKFKIIPIEQNVGLGEALKFGLKHCLNSIVARMDSDDICKSSRFECQFKFLQENPEVSVVGTYIEEFHETPGDMKSIKKVPTNFASIKEYAKKRNPLNHPSVMFRKENIEAAGSYESILLFEDYYLWLKLIAKGYTLANIDEALLYFRVGNDMVGRRHGLSYAKKEIAFIDKIKANGFIDTKTAVISKLLRLPLRLTPKPLLKMMYKGLRKLTK